MAAAAHAGVHGLDPWLESLRALIDAEPVPATLEDALAPLAALGADIAAALRAVERQRRAPPGAWHPDDWRRTHPDFPEKLAFAIFVYTLQDPNIYKPLADAMHAADRAAGEGGVSEAVRACLPFVKLLDVAMLEAAITWGFFVGQAFRGVKFAFPKPTLAEHNPTAYFPMGRELHWFAFQSSSTEFEVMYRPWFCGTTGPRTVFTIQSCEGVSIKRFSAMPDEDEVNSPSSFVRFRSLTFLCSAAGSLRAAVALPRHGLLQEAAAGRPRRQPARQRRIP